MAYPSEERLKNLIEDVRSISTLPYNNRNFNPTTFTGMITEVGNNSLSVLPINLSSVDSDGNLTFDLDIGNYTSTYIQTVTPQNIKNMSGNLPNYYNKGQIINYNRWNAAGNNASSVVGTFVTLASMQMFPVFITQTGGYNGNSTSAATYMYGNVTNLLTNGNISSSGTLQPIWQRPNGEVNIATHGIGYFDPNGNFILFMVDETPQDIIISCGNET